MRGDTMRSTIGCAFGYAFGCAAGVVLLGLLVAQPLRADDARAASVVDAFDTVVIDAGHGGEDVGARSQRGLLEKDVVLDVALRLAKKLRGRDLKVVLTRESDVFVSLEQRTHIANDARGDLFVSIHANAARNPDVRGTETFFLSLDATDEAARQLAERENRAFGGEAAASLATNDPLLAILGDLIVTEHLQESNAFARLAQTGLSRSGPGASRGVKQAPFVVLSGVQMPASLLEIGFITNRDDEGALRGRRGRESIVTELVDAVLAFRQRYDALRGMAGAPAARAQPMRRVGGAPGDRR